MANWNALYPLGALGIGFANTLFNQWIVYFHTAPGTATGPQTGALIGTVLMLNFVFQGLFNPVLGYVGDRIRHPWGRRRIFLLLGSLPLALAFLGTWFFKSLALSLLFICSYGLLFVFVVQPYVALLPSIAPTQAARVRYSLAGGICSLIATGLALVMGPILLDRGSFTSFGILGAAGIALTMFLPALMMRENPSEGPVIRASGSNFFKQLHQLWQNRALRAFVLGNGCVVCVIIALTLVSPFISEALLAKERTYTGTLNLCTLGGIVIAILMVAIKGKNLSFLKLLRNLLIGNGSLILGLLWASSWVTVPLFAWWLAFVSIGTLLLVAMMSPTLVLSELSDRDGQSREGLIFGLNGLVINLGNAFAAQIITLLLTQGHTLENPLGVQWVLGFAGTAALLAAGILTPAIRHLKAPAEQLSVETQS